MFIDRDTYQRLFAGFRVIGGVARSPTIFYFVCELEIYEDADFDLDPSEPTEQEPITRIVVVFLEEPPEIRWKKADFTGFDRLRGGIALQPLEQFVGVDADGRVVSIGNGRKDLEPRIVGHPIGPQRGGIRKLKTINGRVHACSGYRGLGYREHLGQWVSLCDTLPPDRRTDSTRQGFEDFDAFASGEFYAVGGESDVWRRSSEGAWEKLTFPKGYEPITVCCAPDGWVWIGATDGSVFKGRQHTWERVRRGYGPLPHPANPIYPFYDMIWFNGQLLCANEVEVLVCDEEGAWSTLEAPEPIGSVGGHLSAVGNTLLATREKRAVFYNGHQWHLLFDAMSLE